MHGKFRLATLLIIVGAASSFAAGALPTWLQQSIAGYTTHPADAPRSIWVLSHHGSPAYLVVAGCCDRYNDLLDAQGTKICSPSGGLTGHGDGRCAAPVVDPGTPVRLVWRNPRWRGTVIPEGVAVPAPTSAATGPVRPPDA